MMTAPMVKSPKLYLNDTGLCSFLISLDSASELDASPLAGALWETLVCGELRRSQLNRRGGWNLHFWRDRVREADFRCTAPGSSTWLMQNGRSTLRSPAA